MINIVPPVVVFCFIVLIGSMGYFIDVSHNVLTIISNIMIISPIFFGAIATYMLTKRGINNGKCTNR